MIQGLHHLVLFCKDTESAKMWYEKAGFEFSHGFDGMYWFRFGNGEIMLHPADEGGSSTVAIHAAVDDVRQQFAKAVASGLTPRDFIRGGSALTEPVTRPWGDVEFELEDVDGHRWAFTEHKA